MTFVARELEAKARLFQRRPDTHGFPTPREQVAVEIGLVSERLDGVHKSHSNQRRELLRMECVLSTKLLALDSYLPRIPQIRGRGRDSLMRRVEGLQLEGLKRSRDHEIHVAGLQDRLFKLLHQHASLGGAE